MTDLSGPANPLKVDIRRLAAFDFPHAAEALADLLVDCVAGGASVGFMWPLDHERAVAFWHSVGEGVARGDRVLLAAFSDGVIVGTVQLVFAGFDNQPHRADVGKMLVHSSMRRQGIAGRLLAAVEAVAQETGRRVLVLDAVTGGDAERLYTRMGWQRVGVVPDFALMPDGALCATTFFYRHLAHTRAS